MRATLGDPYKDAWDSWPERVWKSDNDSVVLVQETIRSEKKQRTQGVIQCVWNNGGRVPTQAPPTVEVKEEEQEMVMEPVKRPMFFTGDLPHNTIVDISSLNRPDQVPFGEAANQPPRGYEDDPGAKRIMIHKAPFAFEWPENDGWNAQQRLNQRVNIEKNKNPRIWDTPPGNAAKLVADELEKLTAVKWTKESGRGHIHSRCREGTEEAL